MIFLDYIDVGEIEKYFELTGERARIDAKAHKTYIVYENSMGQMIKEHYDGKIELLNEKKDR